MDALKKNMGSIMSRIHERSIRLVYYDLEDLAFNNLLLKHKSITMHLKNLHILATEI